MTDTPIANRTVDIIKTVAIVLVTLFALLTFGSFLWASWQALSDQSRQFVQAWAIVVTVLLPIFAIGFAVFGFYLGIKQSDFVLTGAKAIAQSTLGFAQRVSDVRVNAYSRYRQLSITQPADLAPDPTLFGPVDRASLPSVSTHSQLEE